MNLACGWMTVQGNAGDVVWPVARVLFDVQWGGLLPEALQRRSTEVQNALQVEHFGPDGLGGGS